MGNQSQEAISGSKRALDKVNFDRKQTFGPIDSKSKTADTFRAIKVFSKRMLFKRDGNNIGGFNFNLNFSLMYSNNCDYVGDNTDSTTYYKLESITRGAILLKRIYR